MKRCFTLLGPVLAALMLAGSVSCAQSGAEIGGMSSSASERKTLTILYDKTRFGSAWINDAAQAFKEQMPGVSLQLVGDADADDTLSSALGDGLNVPDIAFVQRTNWQYFAQHGWLRPLTGVYRSASEGKTLAARLDPGLSGFGTFNRKCYVLPWTSGVTGFLYNANLFTENGWSVPRTFADLTALMQQMKAKNITPFAWSGSAQSLWDNVIHAWWMDAEGAAGIRTYLAMGSAGVYAQKGRLTALKSFEQVVSDRQNFVPGPESMDESSMMAALYQGRAAMVPGTAWLAAKYRSAQPKDFSLDMMRVPLPDGVSDAATPLNYTAGGDFVCISAACGQPAAAEKFVETLYSETEARRFFELTGTPLALRSDDAAYAEVSSADTVSRSVLSIWQHSRNITFFSNRAVYYDRLLDWPYSGLPYLSIYSGASTAEQIFTLNAQFAQKHWLS